MYGLTQQSVFPLELESTVLFAVKVAFQSEGRVANPPLRKKPPVTSSLSRSRGVKGNAEVAGLAGG